MTEVRRNLDEFNLRCDLEWIASKPKESFKKLVKAKANEYAFTQMNMKKNSYKKLENVKYSELKMQSYLSNELLSLEEKRTIFKFRSRMADFGDNFKAGRTFTICPLCKLHFDSQLLCLQCPAIKKVLGVDANLNIDDVYSDYVSVKSARILVQVVNERQRLGLEHD